MPLAFSHSHTAPIDRWSTDTVLQLICVFDAQFGKSFTPRQRHIARPVQCYDYFASSTHNLANLLRLVTNKPAY